MPELPEVETIVRGLRPVLPGKVIRRMQVMWPRSVAVPTAGQFMGRVVGQTIQDVGRRGKFIVISLSLETVLVHLRMSGDLRHQVEQTPPAPHDRVDFQFTDGTRLVFNDPRKFGRLWLVREPHDVLNDLGPEPLEGRLSGEEFAARLHHHRRQLKPLLLDQSFLAGLGNIYTDEALHLAGLHPTQISDDLTADQAQRLLWAIRAVLEEGIRRNGASIDWVYRGGEFQNHFRVYQRTGQPCRVCGALIQRIIVGQRGTHFCPTCQPEPSVLRR